MSTEWTAQHRATVQAAYAKTNTKETGESAMRVLIAHAVSGDWAGIYVDGDLKAEGHSLDERTILAAVGIKAGWIEVDLEAFGESNMPPFADEALSMQKGALPTGHAECEGVMGNGPTRSER